MSRSILSLCLILECGREPRNVPLNGAFVPQELDISTINQEFALVALLLVFFAAERCKTPIFRHNNLLAARKFVLGAAESFDGSSAVCRIVVSLVPVNLHTG